MPGTRQKRPDLRAAIALGCCLALNAQAETFSAKVIAVMDGDTVMVLRESGQKLKIRLADIDAPEKDQPGGKRSRDSLFEMLGRKQVQIESRVIDKYGRVIGRVEVAGLDVSRAQVQRGYAWAGERWQRRRTTSGQPATQSPGSQRKRGDTGESYIALQDEAQNAGLGLWAQQDPQPPWQWRKQHPSVAPEAHGLRADIGNKVSAKPVDARCGSKRRCAQMESCEEARFYLEHCGIASLDANADGEPCEKLCKRSQ